MSHFRDAFCVFSRGYSDENVFSVQVPKSLSYERFSTKTRFETEAQSNSEMAYFSLRSLLKGCSAKNNNNPPS